jgi:DNA-directed RNA polymerase subunit RPC12/RpoP
MPDGPDLTAEPDYDALLYRCPECQHVAPWTDGTCAIDEAEQDEFWCQTCGAEVPLSRCEVVTEVTGRG